MRLEDVFGPEWAEIEIEKGGLFLPGWRNPVPPGELRSAFWRTQQAYLLQHHVDRLQADLEKEMMARQEAERRAAYYRALVRNEARAVWVGAVIG